MVYLDVRSQDGSSTHGSTSDETGSSMSTVVDRFSLSDRFSTVSTTSSTSGGASDQHGTFDRFVDENNDEMREFRESIEQDFHLNSSEYMLKRLASSEAATHVESRGEAGGVVERITAVVAPNKVLIEETLTIQPPLSFQDAPLSYGHETRPDLIYTADLAADSTTHFRPIRDEASTVECVNGDTARSSANSDDKELSTDAPSLPARHHVNRINVNPSTDIIRSCKMGSTSQLPAPRDSVERSGPILPPKPLPRKDLKFKRKRPPPPPPPPRREPPPPVPLRGINDNNTPAKVLADVTVVEISNGDGADLGNLENNRIDSTIGNPDETVEFINGNCLPVNGLANEQLVVDSDKSITSVGHRLCDNSSLASPAKINDYPGTEMTNKVLEIIEMKKNKAFGELTPQRSSSSTSQYVDESEDSYSVISPARGYSEVVPAPREKKKLSNIKRASTVSTEFEDSEESTNSSGSDVWQDTKEHQDSSEANTIANDSGSIGGTTVTEGIDIEKSPMVNSLGKSREGDEDNDEDDETYRSLDDMKEDLKSTKNNGTSSSSSSTEEVEKDSAGTIQADSDSTSDDSEDNAEEDYYWQSNLATIGEEEETSSLEYTSA